MNNNTSTAPAFRAKQQIIYKGQHLEIMSASRVYGSYFAFPVELLKRRDKDGNFAMIRIPFGDPDVTLAPDRAEVLPVSMIGEVVP